MASKIRLSVAVGDYEIIRALKEGAVEADGLELVVLTGHGPRERHWRMARNQEFDVCEFNVGGYLMSRDHGAVVQRTAGIEDRNDSRRQVDGHDARRRRDTGDDQSIHSSTDGRRR